MLHHGDPGEPAAAASIERRWARARKNHHASIATARAAAGVILNFNNDTLSLATAAAAHIHSTAAVHFHYTFGELPGVWSARANFPHLLYFSCGIEIAAAGRQHRVWVDDARRRHRDSFIGRRMTYVVQMQLSELIPPPSSVGR